MALQHPALQLQLPAGAAQFSPPEGGAAALHKHAAMLHAAGELGGGNQGPPQARLQSSACRISAAQR